MYECSVVKWGSGILTSTFSPTWMCSWSWSKITDCVKSAHILKINASQCISFGLFILASDCCLTGMNWCLVREHLCNRLPAIWAAPTGTETRNQTTIYKLRGEGRLKYYNVDINVWKSENLQRLRVDNYTFKLLSIDSSLTHFPWICFWKMYLSKTVLIVLTVL